MAGYLSQNLRFLVGKIETTAGTMETLTGADFDVRIRDPQITINVEVDDENSKWARGDHGEDHTITGIQTAQITFSVRCAWSGAVASEPDWSKFLKGCGAKAVTYASTGIGYQPLKEYDIKTMTLWMYDCQTGATPSAVCYKIKGAMGNCVIGADGVGKPWMASFTFSGVVSDVVDVAYASIPLAMGLDTSCSDKMLSNIAYVGTVAEKISSFQLDFGNEINAVLDQSDAAGVAYYMITARRPRLTMNPLAQLVATRDVFGQLTSGLTGCPDTFRIGIGDTGLDNKFWLEAPKAQLISAAVANREGIVAWDQSFKLQANGVTGALTNSVFSPETTFEILQGKRA
jgi:hypothetical protein